MKTQLLIIGISLIILINVFSGCIEDSSDHGDEGEEKYSIQQLIDKASPRDIISVKSGTYYENIVINKSITLLGENKETTIIDGNNHCAVVTILSENVSISNFTIQNGSTCSLWSGGVYITDGSKHNKITNNIITENSVGITIGDSDNIISENNLVYNEEGILVHAEKNIITNNDISKNDVVGIKLFSSNNVIIRNIITKNAFSDISSATLDYQAGIYLVDSSNNLISGNLLLDTKFGIRVLTSNNNTISENNIINNNATGIHLYCSFNNSIYHNNFISNYYQAYDDSNNSWYIGSNIWYCESTLDGNYWDDYNGEDISLYSFPGSDGIGDTPYNISGGNNYDLYPLMIPVAILNIKTPEIEFKVDNHSSMITVGNISSSGLSWSDINISVSEGYDEIIFVYHMYQGVAFRYGNGSSCPTIWRNIRIGNILSFPSRCRVTLKWIPHNTKIGEWYLPLLQILDEGFGIYLIDNDQFIISDEDIISYNKSTHEITLTEEGANKIKSLEIGTGGKRFVIKLNETEMYNGSFWSSFSSLAYLGVVIMDPRFIQNSIQLELGYPSPEVFEGDDPRNNTEIFDYFKNIGKLIE